MEARKDDRGLMSQCKDAKFSQQLINVVDDNIVRRCGNGCDWVCYGAPFATSQLYDITSGYLR
jgi:hypothetical protein